MQRGVLQITSIESSFQPCEHLSRLSRCCTQEGQNVSYAAFTPAQLVAQQAARNTQLVAGNKHQVARNLLRATCCAGVNAALDSLEVAKCLHPQNG